MLGSNPQQDQADAQIREGLAGNLCEWTGEEYRREGPPLVDGRSAEFDRLAVAIANELAGELTAAGYSSR